MSFDLKSLADLLKHAGSGDLAGPDVITIVPTGPDPMGMAAPLDGSADGGATQTVLYSPDGGSGMASKAGGVGAGGTTTLSPSAATASSFVINISWDSSVSSAPSGFTTAVIAAAQYLESHFTDAVTVNISVGYGEVNGTSLGNGVLGESISYLSSVGYSALRGALANDATSSLDSSAVASLPASSPVSGNLWTTTADAKALGLVAANGTATDGYVGFSSTLPFTYNSTSIASGTYDFNGVALHEMTEVMGRLLLTGSTVGRYPSSYNLMDLFHYSSAGVRDFSASTPGYLSADGGNSSLGTFNTVTGGDAGDWATSMGADAFDAFSNSGVVEPVTTNDLNAIDLIGWNLAGTSSPPPAPTGIAATAMTAGLAAAQTSGGLAAGAALATIVQTGGSSADSYSYALGGTDAASFNLVTAGNAATLAVGANALQAATTSGQLFALTITPTDTTANQSGPASPLDVIVGTAGGDSVSLATLSGSIGAATPTFVYGLGGNDSLNGTGMTGPLWLAGGAGADTMSGGGGANDYLYGATSESTLNAMDVITNFHAATDAIDLTGLGVALKYAGKLKSGSIGANSVGWQTSGGNTFVYVNNSGGTEKLTAADMKIELLGAPSLASGNFAHL